MATDARPSQFQPQTFLFFFFFKKKKNVFFFKKKKKKTFEVSCGASALPNFIRFSQMWRSCTAQSTSVTSISPKFLALEELRFNETRRENVPITSFDAWHLFASLISLCLLESVDKIRRGHRPTTFSVFRTVPATDTTTETRRSTAPKSRRRRCSQAFARSRCRSTWRQRALRRHVDTRTSCDSLTCREAESVAPARDGGHADRCRGGCCTGGVNEQRVLRRSQAVDRRKSLRSNSLSGTQRAAQALEGQRQRCPPQVPKPVNWTVWSAAATELRRRGKVLQATLELVAVDACLHLSEAH